MAGIQFGDWADFPALSALATMSVLAAAIGALVAARALAARRRGRTGLDRPNVVLEALTAHVAGGTENACILFAVDGDGPSAERVARLLRGVARADDLIVATGAGRIAMVARGVRREVDLAALVCRCQAAAEDQLNGASLSAGLALWRRGSTAEGVIEAAERALAVAMARGRGEMEMADAKTPARCRVEEPEASPMLETWIEPRIEALSRRVSAITPIPRWRHPALGLLDARDVLDAGSTDDARATLLMRLLDDGLSALHRLDGAGHDIPILSLPISAGAVRVPGLVARIIFALDGADIAPERLELRLSGAISPSDVTAIAQIGCRVAAAPEIVRCLPETVGPAAPLILLDRASLRTETLDNPESDRPIVALDVDHPDEADRLVALGIRELQGPAIAELKQVPEIANWIANRSRAAESGRAVGR